MKRRRCTVVEKSDMTTMLLIKCEQNGSKEKISFTESSFTDAISQGNAQTYGPNGAFGYSTFITKPYPEMFCPKVTCPDSARDSHFNFQN